ncbi:MAG: P1 family peptidase [Succinivibrio sp.]|nr:P1 family peptidase [Succinivibrio sp.]
MSTCLSRMLTAIALVSWSLGGNAALDVLRPRTIELNAFDAVKFASVTDDEAKTGVTLALFPQGAQAAVHISGGGPASRESPVIGPWAAPTPVNAVVLAGGSAYGLAAADGVMSCLEEHGIGFDTGRAKVPIVVQSDIYDLGYGSAARRPDAAMGRQACELALSGSTIQSGSYGAGSGATVGKLRGMRRAQKAGQGIAVLQAGELKVVALVVVNALGDVIDERNGTKLAGLLDERRLGFVDSREAFYARAPGAEAQKTTLPSAW